MDTPGSPRLFFALWPHDAARTALMQLQSGLQGKITPYANLHLTLAFLGQQPASRLPELKQILAHLPRTDLTLRLDRIGYFPRKRIVWAGMHEVPESLLDLQRALAAALARYHIAVDTANAFTPHVTLARDAEQPPDAAFTPVVWQVDQISLVKSVARPDGVHYEPIVSRPIDRDVRVADEVKGNEAAGMGSE